MKALSVRSFLQLLSVLAIALSLPGCNGESPTAPLAPVAPPTAPAPPASSRPGYVWGYVFTSTGACIRDAVVEVVDGSRAGAISVQKDCNFDDGLGYEFRDLPGDVTVRMRASKAGFQSQELTFFATTGPAYQSNFRLVAE